jgi:hypothetical protein
MNALPINDGAFIFPEKKTMQTGRFLHTNPQGDTEEEKTENPQPKVSWIPEAYTELEETV